MAGNRRGFYTDHAQANSSSLATTRVRTPCSRNLCEGVHDSMRFSADQPPLDNGAE